MAQIFRLFGVVLAAVLLTACVPVHPGTAAKVAGDRVTMEEADQITHVLCAVNTAASGGQGGFNSVDVRRQAVMNLIVAKVADQLATEAGLDIRVPEEDNEQLDMLRGMLDPKDVDAFDQLVDVQNRMTAIAEALGKKDFPDEQSIEALQEAGFNQILFEVQKRDIEIDPRFAMTVEGEALSDSGSLSALTSTLDGFVTSGISPLVNCN